MIILKVTKEQGLTLSLEDTFFEKPQGGGQIDPLPSRFRVNTERTTIFIFYCFIKLVTQLNGSALGVLKHHYNSKRIHELLIGRFLIHDSLNQLLYYTDIRERCLFVAKIVET